MSIEQLKERMPGYAKDIRLNLSSLVNEDVLSEQQKWGAFLASALAGRNAEVIAAISSEASGHLSAEAAEAARIAAAIMAMNNIYYRFVHLASNTEYGKMPARLRMNAMSNPGVEKADFELWALAVSAINGCGMCIDSHEQHILKEGVTREQIQAAVRIAATVQAASAILDGEAAMQAAGTAAQAA